MVHPSEDLLFYVFFITQIMNNNINHQPGSCFQNYEQEAANHDQSNIILAFCIKQIFKASEVKVDQYTLLEQL